MGVILPLTVSPMQAMVLLRAVGSVEFQQGLTNHFWINPDDTVGPQAWNWLYCWATAGWPKAGIAANVQNVWKQIFNIPLAAFNSLVLRPIAQGNRYQP
jgi:hypothetical protein